MADEKSLGNLVRRMTSSATSSADYELDAKLLKQFRLMIRDLMSPGSIGKTPVELLGQVVYGMVIGRLTRPNCVIRLLTTRLIDWLFKRSSVFRHMLLGDFCRFMQLTCGVGALGHTLPVEPDPRLALRLKAESIQLIRRWTDEFYTTNNGLFQFSIDGRNCGSGASEGEEFDRKTRYFRLYLAQEYLSSSNDNNEWQRDGRRLPSATTVDASVSRSILSARLRVGERQKRALRANMEVYRRMITDESVDMMDRIRENMKETRGLVEILVPINIDAALFNNVDVSTSQIIGNEIVQAESGTIPIQVSQLRPKALETEDNSVIFEALRNSLQLIYKTHLPWLEKLDRLNKSVGVLIYSSVDSDRRIVEQCGLLCRNLKQLVEMCRELGVVADERWEEERMEEVPLMVQPDNLLDEPLSYGSLNDESTRSSESDAVVVESRPQQPVDDENETFEDLMRRAPVVEYGEDLHYWDQSKVSFNQSGLEFHHRFMGDGRGENLLSSQTLDRLRKRVISYRVPAMAPTPTTEAPLNSSGSAISMPSSPSSTLPQSVTNIRRNNAAKKRTGKLSVLDRIKRQRN